MCCRVLCTLYMKAGRKKAVVESGAVDNRVYKVDFVANAWEVLYFILFYRTSFYTEFDWKSWKSL